MKSFAELFALLLAAAPVQGGVVSFQGVVGPQEPEGAGPRGSSQPAGGEARVDLVDQAEVTGMAGIAVTAPGLSPGDTAEVTNLDNGRIIAARVDAGTRLTLSMAAAAALGITAPTATVRVRRVVATPQDASALMRGEAAQARPDAPSALLAALRRKAAPAPAVPAKRESAAKPRPRPKAVAPTPAATPAPRRGTIGVQVAALSDLGNARALASKLGGQVVSGGGLHRVQLGPFATQAEARAARQSAARRGYPDARIITVNQ